MRPKNTPKLTIVATRDELDLLPGIYELGSEPDLYLISLRKNSPAFFPEQDNDITRVNIGVKRHHAKGRYINSVIEPNEKRGSADRERLWLASLDEQIRFCRWFLAMHSLPHDKSSVLVSNEDRLDWVFAEDNYDPQKYHAIADPIRYFLPRLDAERYYAMKFLAHFRRFEHVFDNPSSNSHDDMIAIGRESYMMGELWSEISFLSEHLPNLVSGQKFSLKGQSGNEERTRTSFASLNGIDAQAMADQIAARKPNLSWQAIRNKVAAHFGVSAETVKKTLTNPKKAR